MPEPAKKLLWAALLIGLILLCWPRVGKREEAKGVVEITYMAPEGPLRDAVEEAVREFEWLSDQRHLETDGAYPRYRVVAGQNASANQSEDPTRFLLSLVGGEPPDVIFFDRFAISEWAARGAFAPLDSFIERDFEAWQSYTNGRSSYPPWPGADPEPPRADGAQPLAGVDPIRPENFYPGFWEEAHYRDPVSGSEGQYGIPANADNRVLLYNKDILIRNGYTNELGEARPPRTWEELEDMAVRMTRRDDEGRIRTVGFIPNYGNSWLYLYGWQAGGRFMSADGLTCTLNDSNIVYALDFMTRVYDRLGGAEAINAFQSTTQGDALDPFIQGKIGMKIDGVWIMESLVRFGADLNLGAAPPPMPERELAKGRSPISWMGGFAYAIPATSPRQEHAWELIRFLCSDRAHRIMQHSEFFARLAQGLPFVPRQFPNRAQNEWAFEQYVENNPRLDEKFKDAMRTFNGLLEHSRYRPVTPVGQKLWNAQIAAMEDAMYHKKTAQEALDYQTLLVQRDLDRVLSPPQGRLITDWSWFYALYAAVVLLVVGVVYWRDTREGGRSGLEGRKGSYFRSQWKEGIICALPWMVGFLVFSGGPLLFSFVISFCRYDILNPASFTGLYNYRHMLGGDELFWKSLGNTLYMVAGVPLGMLISLSMAMLLTREIRGVAVWRTFFYLPSIVPMVATSILWVWIFNPDSGMLNQLLALAGLNGPNWLQSEHTSKISLILMGLWAAGGGMIVWIAGIKSISQSYYEAAAIDGAGPWQQFVNITLPLLSPYIFFNLIMGLIATFQVFAQAFIMTNGGPANSTLFFVYHLFNNAFRFLHMGYAAAMAWFLFVIVLILTAIQMHLSKHWVHYEGD